MMKSDALPPALCAGAAAALFALAALVGGCGASNAYTSTAEPTPTPSASPSPVPVSGIAVSAAPEVQTLNAGATVAYAVTLTPTNGFSGRVDLAAAGLPEAVTASFGENTSVAFAPGETGPRAVTLTLGLPVAIGADRPSVPFEVVATPQGAPEKTARAAARVILNSTGTVGGVIQ